MIKYQKAALKYEDKQQCVEIIACTKASRVKDCVVSAIYTFDEWKTVRNKAGSFAVSKEKENLYRIAIPINAIVNVKMWFAIKLSIYNPVSNSSCNNNSACEEIWDNNNGWNYEIHTEKLPKICPAPPKTITTATTTNNTNTSNNQSTNSKIDKPQHAPPHPSPPYNNNPNTSNVFILKLDNNNINNILTTNNNNKYSGSSSQKLLSNLTTNKIISKPLDNNLPLIMFSSKMRNSPFSLIMPEDAKRPDILISKEMRAVYNRYVF